MPDKGIVTIAAVVDNSEQADSSLQDRVSDNLQSSSNNSSPNGATDTERDFISLLTSISLSFKESKKQAMGDVRSSDDPIKNATETTVSQIVTDNDSNNQKQQLKLLKIEAKSAETKKVQQMRPSDDVRRRVNGIFYAGHGRRGSVNYGSRPATYTSRGYWRPRLLGACNSNGSRHSATGIGNNQIHQINNTAQATGTVARASNTGIINQRIAAINDSSKNDSAFPFRTQVTRTFHNGALRANRMWRGNLTSRSRSHTVTSEFSSQFSSSEHATSSETYVNSNAVASRTAEACLSIGNAISDRRNGKFPIIYVAPTGTISILLDKGVMIEVAVDRAVRVLCHDKFSAVCNGRGTGSCILHTKARIFQQDEKVFCNFGSNSAANEKAAVFGTQGVLFTMSHLSEAFLVSSTIVKGTLSVSLGRLQFPSLDYDFTVRMFFTESQTGDQFTTLCNEIVQEARYGNREDGSLTLAINGVYIKQDERGDVEVNCRPKHVSCSPSDGTVHIRTSMVDMAVQEDDKAFVKRGLKRVHVSRSGMVVSDGNSITSMDHFGNIVSST
uniref:Altered inheritance of mitochondria protein 24, mitochondrial n=1 Tax=Setaria digitata TaxID=48799 RepID=A0A915PU72_9BILA